MSWASREAMNTSARMKMNCATASALCRKKYRVTRGNTTPTPTQYIAISPSSPSSLTRRNVE